jgi:hypothetical protein
LSNFNTIKTACDACGISERVYYDWCQKYPAFYAATRKARAQAKIKLVNILSKAAKTNPNHAQWLLERSWPDEYSRVSVERVEQIGEKAKDDFSLKIYYDTKGRPFSELLAFPIHKSMGKGHDSPEVAREKQRRLTGEKAEAPETISEHEDEMDSAPEDEETISDAPPSTVVNPAPTGRIPA